MTRSGGRVPPGRLGLPWLGETTAIARSNHGFYTDRFERYGPIFKTRLFGINFVVLSGAEAFHRFATDPAIEAHRCVDQRLDAEALNQRGR